MAFKGKGKTAMKAKGASKGNAKGKSTGPTKLSAGSWAWIPAAPLKTTAPVKGGKGSKGKGKVKNWMSTRAPAPWTKPVLKSAGKGNATGKGKGKGKGTVKPDNKFLDKLQDIDASLKVWVGGLDEKASWKKVEAHFKDVGKVKVALMPKGKACLAFDTPDEVDNAIATFNGSEFGGKEIQVDVWTQKEKKVREAGDRKEKKKKLVKTGFAAKIIKSKGKGNGKGKGKKLSKFAEKLKEMDRAQKVWVGSLTEKVTVKMLKQHFQELGSEIDVAELMKKGTACVGFKSEEEAESAISAVNGSELDGEAITVDVWAKPEKREKKKKTDAEE